MYLGMKHSPPFVAEGVGEMRRDGIARAVGERRDTLRVADLVARGAARPGHERRGGAVRGKLPGKAAEGYVRTTTCSSSTGTTT